MLVGASAMTHYAREAMHDVIENLTGDGARDSQLIWRAWRNTYPFIVVGALWEAVAHLGIFPAQFFPPLETIAAAFVRLSASGVLPHHAFDTLIRLTAGFALAAVVGIAAGVLMGRSRRAEDIMLPLVSIGAPIPGLAYAPLFLLWFGPGNIPAVALVAFACFAMSCSQGHCRISSPACGLVSPRPGAFWLPSRCSRRCHGAWAG